MYHKARIYVFPVLLLCAVLSFIISGCTKNNEVGFTPKAVLPISNPTTTNTTTTTQTLTWEAPITYTNGDALAENSITEYKVYYSTIPGSYAPGSFYSVSDPNSALTPTSVTVKDVTSQATGTYYFVVTAVVNGAESAFSNEVSKQVN
jgi:hypothetical protein